jgi:AraC-like DNA-binding protein
MEPPMAVPASGATELRFSTKAMPGAAWREEFARGFLRVDIEPEQHDRFQADATIRAFPGLKIASCTISASHWRRTRTLLDPGTEYFGLMFGMEGPALLSQRGRTLELGAGDAATCSHAQPADLVLPCENGRHVGLVVPFKPMAALVPDLEGTIPRRIARHSDPLRLLVGYLDALADAATLADPELCRTVVTHVHDLIALALGAGRDGAEIASGRGLRAARLRAVKTDVLANLASHELSAATIAKRQGITPRYVHMLFEAEGTTFSHFVVGRRLALARRLLSDPRHDRRTITEIAFEAGFGDLSYFNRVFRRSFGMTPRDARRTSGEGTA